MKADGIPGHLSHSFSLNANAIRPPDGRMIDFSRVTDSFSHVQVPG